MTDAQATVSQLWVYPVKSCAGVMVQEATLTDMGLLHDRCWMVVDAHGEMVSQRDVPQMALIQPSLRLSDVVLRAPGMLALHLALFEVQEPLKVQLWGQIMPAFDMGDVAAQWFSDFLGQTPEGKALGPLRLARFDPDHVRLSSTQWTGTVAAKTNSATATHIWCAAKLLWMT